MPDIYSLIKDDHKTHRDLLTKIADTQGDFDARRTLWERFYYDVKAHAAAEEETFYARLMGDPDGQEPARHSVAEHKQMDDIMDELAKMDITSSGWLNRFETLKHEYEHHMDEEENEIFAKSKKVFSDSETDTFGERFQKRKAAERKLVDQKSDAKLED